MDDSALDRLNTLVERAGGRTKQDYMKLASKIASSAADAFEDGEYRYVVHMSEFTGYDPDIIAKLLGKMYPLYAAIHDKVSLVIRLSDYDGTMLL